VIAIVAVIVAIVVAGRRSSNTVASGTTTTRSPLEDLRNSSTTSLPTGPPASLPTVTAGATASGAVPCPKTDGSSPRTTSFPQGIPMCIDPTLTYDATIKTSVGDALFHLQPEEGAETVNSFYVLALYHYWDGAPITTIKPNEVFVVNNPIPGGPGYTIPNQSPPQGTIYPVGRIAMVAGPGNTVDPGTFQVALGEDAASLPKNTPTFGILLDAGINEKGEPDMHVLQSIRKSGSKTGAPTGTAITINSISIVVSVASTNTTPTVTAGS
jgi:cyclophilin family peptidyl-prolyl cis-trans isomerase